MILNFDDINKKRNALGITLLNELEINGRSTDDEENKPTDYTEDNENDNAEGGNNPPPAEDNTAEENEGNAETEDAPDLATPNTNDGEATDYTEEGNKEEPTDDNTQEEDSNADEDAGDEESGEVTDYTEEGDDDGGEQEEPTDDGGTDYTDDAAGDTGGDSEGDDGSATDYTDDGGSDDATGDSDSSEGDEDTGGEDTGEDAEDDGEDLNALEKELFSDLSPQQLSIKNTELLKNYIDLYTTVDLIIQDLDRIDKTAENTKRIEFIQTKLTELRDITNFTITTTYITRTYVENLSNYKQSLLMLQQINSMLKSLIKKPKAE